MCTKETIIEAILAFYQENGRAPLSSKPEIVYTKRMVQTRFGSWNNALIEAGIPLNKQKSRTVNCITCNTIFKKDMCQMQKSLQNFCSSACAAINRNTGRPQSEETKRKISESLRARHTYNNPCIVCGHIHSFRKRKTCSRECLKALKQALFKKK